MCDEIFKNNKPYLEEMEAALQGVGNGFFNDVSNVFELDADMSPRQEIIDKLLGRMKKTKAKPQYRSLDDAWES